MNIITRKITNARDMVPGKTYQGTADGPEALDGVTFTVLAVVTFDPTGGVPDEDGLDDVGPLLQVQYDAWGWPFPESQTFAAYDVVFPMDDPNRLMEDVN